MQRHLFTKDGEDEACTFFAGNAAKSFILKEIFPLDRELIQAIFERFPCEKYGGSDLYNWYYNDPQFPARFGTVRDKNGRFFPDANLIGSKFRNVPLLPPEITAWLLETCQARARLPPEEYKAHNIKYGEKVI